MGHRAAMSAKGIAAALAIVLAILAFSTAVHASDPQACTVDVASLPAVCNGGSIAYDTDLRTCDNCRHIMCWDGVNSMGVRVCVKPDETAPQYFEMYKVWQDRSGMSICLGSTCIRDNGFARSPDFPICG